MPEFRSNRDRANAIQAERRRMWEKKLRDDRESGLFDLDRSI